MSDVRKKVHLLRHNGSGVYPVGVMPHVTLLKNRVVISIIHSRSVNSLCCCKLIAY